MNGPNYTAEAAIKCGEPLFQQFLADATQHTVTNKEQAAEAFRQYCQIESRKELNTSDKAAQRWQTIKKWFKQWRLGYGRDGQGLPRSSHMMGREAFKRGADLEENPFDPHEPLDFGENDHSFWASGWTNEQRRKDHPPLS